MGNNLQQNILADTLDAAGIMAQYDGWAVRIVSQKIILAWILKHCTEEFSGYSIRYIRDNCIEGIPMVQCCEAALDCNDACSFSDNGYTDADCSGKSEMIQGLNTVDKSVNEGTNTYDIKFNAAVPGFNSIIQMIINIEVQQDDSPGYPVTKRGIYYGCRMVSGQYGTIFAGSHYEKLRKVYSIWICTDTAKVRRGSIRSYSFEENVHMGNYHEQRQNYDLMDIVILGLGDDGEKSNSELVDMLTVLFSDKLNPEEKKRRLTEEYNIAMTREIDEEVDNMCNLSEGIYRKGIKEGISQGITQGISQGITQGITQGISQGITKGITEGRNQGVLLTYINMIMRKLGRDKREDMIINEMLEDTDASEEEVRRIYGVVSSNRQSSAQEVLELMMAEM